MVIFPTIELKIFAYYARIVTLKLQLSEEREKNLYPIINVWAAGACLSKE